jgi:ribosome-associated toxin RatA of RatAB toxin-antitoxin module
VITIDYQTEYPHPADAIFALVVDVTRYPQWQPDVVSATTMEPMARGTEVREVRKVMGRQADVLLVAVEYEPGQRLTLATPAGAQPAVRQTYRLTAVSAGSCRLDFHLELDGVPRMAEPLLRTQLTHQAKRIFAALGTLAANTTTSA